MPNHELIEMLVRLGLAVGAGLMIFLVPICIRRTHYEPALAKRIAFHLLALLAFVAFCGIGWFIWRNFIPHEPEPPPPVTYPAAPTVP